MKAGDTLGPFRIETELGSGGMGTVYRAALEVPFASYEAGRSVAIKIVHPHLLAEGAFLDRFRREGEIGRSVRHANVVRTLGSTEVGGSHILVMEYAEGKTLRALLEELGPLPEALCRMIAREICRGLVAIHDAGVIHRDLKPENVVIAPDQRSVKIMDLGLARVADEAFRLSVAGAFVGSVRYAAPEQFLNGGADLDHRVDLHGLGLLLYELASGVHPYDADDMPELIGRVLNEPPRPLGEIQPHLTPFFEEVVHTLLSKDRQGRFPNARALEQVLLEGERSAWWRQRAREIRSATQEPPRRIQLPREAALVGREAEVEALLSLYRRARGGQGQVLLVEGEAGIGKSRLVDEFVSRLQADGEEMHVLIGAYPQSGAATGAGAFSTAYREHLGDGGVEAHLADTPLLVEAFEALLRGEALPARGETLTPTSLATCFLGVTRSLAKERPTIVLIDDLHLAPEEGRRLFTAVARGVAAHPVLLVGTMQPGVPPEWLGEVTALGHATHLELPRLGMQDVFRLLHDTFRSERIAATLAETVTRQSDGNPFFVFEIVHGLLETGLVNRDGDSEWTLTGALDHIEIPSSVREVVDARMEDLTPDERELLDVAACWGFEFDPRLVADALGVPPLQALRHYARIEARRRLVRAKGPQFVFDHHQVRESLYEALLPEVRTRYHTALAEALETRTKAAEKEPRELDGALVVDLSDHFLRSRAPERALRYVDAALAHLESGYLHAEAPALAERVLAVPDLLRGTSRARTLLRLASRLDLLGHRERQLEVCRELETVARDCADASLYARACRSLGVAYSRLSDYEIAKKWLEEARNVAVKSGVPREEAAATGELGNLHWATGRITKAREYHERHLALARELGDRAQESRALLDLGNVYQTQGCPDEARARYEALLEIAKEGGDRRSEAAALGNVGNVLYLQGRLERAREFLGRALATTQEIGDRRGEARILGNMGAVFEAEGRFAEAHALLKRSLDLSREVGDLRGQSNALSNLTEVVAARGDLGAALAYGHENLELSRRGRYREGEALALVGLAGAAHRLGDSAVARSRFEWALAAARTAELRAVEAAGLAGLAALLADAGAWEEAADRYREALALCRRMGHRRGIAGALLGLSALHHERGERRLATEMAAEATEMAAMTGEAALRLRAAVCAAWVGAAPVEDARETSVECAGRTGCFDRIEADVRLWRLTGEGAYADEARGLLEEAVGLAPEEYRSSMVENVPLHRMVAAAPTP